MNTEAEIVEFLNTSPTLKFQPYEGVTHMRLTYERGEPMDWNLESVQGKNIFQNAGVTSAKFGAIVKGKFAELPNGGVEILNQKREQRENMDTKTKIKKKTVTKKTGEKKVGKIQFVESLLNGELTKAQITARVVQKFKIAPETARNTVNWTCSTMKERTGKEPKFKVAGE